MGQAYSSPQACKLADVTYRQLDYWCRIGLVGPSVRVASGSGSQRGFSRDDVVQVMVAKALMEHGIRGQTVREAMAVLDGPHPFLWIVDGQVLAGDAFDVLTAVQAARRPLFLLPVDPLREAVDREGVPVSA